GEHGGDAVQARHRQEVRIGVVHHLGALVRVQVPGLARVVGALDGGDLLEPENGVRVHEPWIDVLAGAVDDLGAAGHGDAGADGGDLGAFHEHGAVRDLGPGHRVHGAAG